MLQAGPSVRHQSLQAMLRMMYYGTAELLQVVLSSLPISRLFYAFAVLEIVLCTCHRVLYLNTLEILKISKVRIF